MQNLEPKSLDDKMIVWVFHELWATTRELWVRTEVSRLTYSQSPNLR